MAHCCGAGILTQEKTAFVGFYIINVNLDQGRIPDPIQEPSNPGLVWEPTCTGDVHATCTLEGGQQCIGEPEFGADCGVEVSDIADESTESGNDLKVRI